MLINDCVNKIRFFFNTNKIKIVVVTVSIIALLLIVEVVLNLWVRQSLRRAFITLPEPDTKIDASINWISIFDFKNGRIRQLRVKGWNCTLSELKFKELSVVSKGFQFDLNSLVRDQQLVFNTIGATEVKAVITAASLTEYLKIRYPDLKPVITIEADNLRYIGELEALGRPISIQVEGGLQVSGFKKLRFYPQKMQVLNHRIPNSLLKFIGTQLPIEFAVLEEWPLKITNFSLSKGLMRIVLNEIPVEQQANGF